MARGVPVAQAPVQTAAPATAPVQPAAPVAAPVPEQAPPPPMEDDLPPWDLEPEAPPAPKPVKKPAPVKAAPPQQKPAAPAPKAAPPAVHGGGDWAGFVKSMREVPPMLLSFLRKPGTVTGVFGENVLTLWVDSDFTQGILSKPDTKTFLERSAESYTGHPRRVLIKVGQPGPEDLAPAPVTPAPQEDPFRDLMERSRPYDNFTVK